MDRKLKRQRNKIIIALVIFGALFAAELILEHTVGLPYPFDNHWILMIPYLVPYLIVGFPVVKEAVLGIARGQVFDESFLMTIATIGAFVIGENSEACAVMLFYQVGELFQDYAVGKSRRSITELMEIAPEIANVQRADGSIEEIDPDDVEIGDILVIKPGEKIPVDGVVVDGRSMLNTAALTGESVPRSAKEGDQVISGCVNGEGLLRVRAEKKYEDSTVAKILEMVEDATSRKSRTENFITRFARYYTPIVVISALALAVIPSIITRDPGTWILRACTFLVISCPCALVISVPLSFFGGIGAASRLGVLVKGSNYLELMSKLGTVVSDKTGTLTKGEFKVTRIVPAEGADEGDVLELAAAAESLSTHPIAMSITEACGSQVPADVEVTNVSGKGVIAEVPGKGRVLAGNASLLKGEGVEIPESHILKDASETVVYIACNGAFKGMIVIADSIKEGAAEAIRDMKAEGAERFIMLTGDREGAAASIAGKLGITEYFAELLPGDKVAKVEELLSEAGGADNGKRGRLAFIGDGINDAPVLSRADIGIAMGSMGSDAAIEAADVVIMDDDLSRISKVMRIARKTVHIATQNIVFALAVKLLVLILGAAGFANMWAAVFADVGVAVICIINSMRMLRRK